jgi:hypothetical protein
MEQNLGVMAFLEGVVFGLEKDCRQIGFCQPPDEAIGQL